MGHSAEINENVYQCPIGLKEITIVGGFLTSIDISTQTDGNSDEASEKQPIEDLPNEQCDNSSLSEYDIQESCPSSLSPPRRRIVPLFPRTTINLTR
ncbi:hypothetical protein KUTeg_004681 [Tegillarca granosa]|uniref:Uncharacterized protein n=1 Tax=Tegillarca granosa TaxID=220873 RepID=A0ABQ9FKD1_TEGGR|nr:hypothetical protein KUTeg_004681 [Tegillarca granosa]